MNKELSSPPFLHAGESVAGLMRLVVIALLPGLIMKTWFSGLQVLLTLLLLAVAALALEAGWVRLRGRAPLASLRDGSALLTALLLTLALPATTPWWVALTGIAFAILVVKQAFGGLGQNVFNPAMGAYVFLLLAFPRAFDATDGMAATTPLMQTNGAMILDLATGQLLALAYLAGAILLLARGVIGWLIPAAVVLGAGLCLLTQAPGQTVGLLQFLLLQLLSPGLILGAFFLATDPVTAPVTVWARLVYGVLIGALIVVIPQGGQYADGVAFAIVLANFFAPLLDQALRPGVFGRRVAALDDEPEVG